MKDVLQEVARAIMPVRERAITKQQQEQFVWKIWGECRLHKDKLDSEKHCKVIRECVDAMISSIQKRLEDCHASLLAEQKLNKELNKEIRKLKKWVASDILKENGEQKRTDMAERLAKATKGK